VRLGAAALTDQRHELTVGDEVELVLVPDRLELAAAAIFEHRFDPDDRRATSATWRTAGSAVVRAQLALTPYVSLLGETSLAREVARGPAAKDTWQGKAGVVLSPAGTGLAARPALRALYGVQRCSLPGAWPGAAGGGRWHQLVSLEAEAWF
jgi:maltoporin